MTRSDQRNDQQTPRVEATKGALHLSQVSKSYDDDVLAVDDVDLDVKPGEFITLLGPSGSGKTTTLRIIAGFIRNDSGTVVLDGRDLAGVPPYKRDIGMVFQNYALFPHMTASDNIAFPLKMRGFGRKEIQLLMLEALEQVHLSGLGNRYPRQLSGGQQQRVAVARAIVFNPRLLLMDEPLGALDKKLRESLQLELMRLSRQLDISVIYVTHDQDEALVMSDRIAIYDHGRIRQIGTAEELYEKPASLFVAGFVGESNIFPGSLERRSGGTVLINEDGVIRLDPDEIERVALDYGRPATLVVRPERMTIRPAALSGGLTSWAVELRGRVQESIYLGSSRKHIIRLASGNTANVRLQHLDGVAASLSVGDDVIVGWERRNGILVSQMV